MWVASIQPPQASTADDRVPMLDRGWKLVQQAADLGAKLIVLPEYFNVFGLDAAATKREAAAAAGFMEQGSSRAKNSNVFLLLPMIVYDNHQYRNRAYLFDPAGEVAYYYDKVHLTPNEVEDLELTPGDRIETVDTAVGKIGVMTCYDVYFPELTRVLGLAGVQLILFPSLQRNESESTAKMLTRVRAMDAWSYVIRSSYGQPPHRPFAPGMMFGGSCIVHPDGSVLADAGRGVGMAIAQIDLEVSWQRRPCHGRPAQSVAQFIKRDRRASLYKRLAQDDTASSSAIRQG